jgi:hypothetical protein
VAGRDTLKDDFAKLFAADAKPTPRWQVIDEAPIFHDWIRGTSGRCLRQADIGFIGIYRPAAVRTR